MYADGSIEIFSRHAGMLSKHWSMRLIRYGSAPPPCDGDDLQARVAVEEAVVDHPRDRERRVEREADRRGQLEAHHVHVGDAGRRGRMHEHRQRLRVDRRPDRRERVVGQRARRRCSRAPSRRTRRPRTRARARRARARGTATGSTRTSAAGPGCAACADAMSSFMMRAACRLTSGAAPEHVRTGERHDADVDAALRSSSARRRS